MMLHRETVWEGKQEVCGESHYSSTSLLLLVKEELYNIMESFRMEKTVTVGDGLVVGKQQLLSIQNNFCPVAGRWGKNKKKERREVKLKWGERSDQT